MRKLLTSPLRGAASSSSAASTAAAAPLFDKVLIANRGEIACRVMRTCRRLNIRTVAVYSDADAGAQHVQLADEAVRLGPGPSPDSYLRVDRILEACAATGAQAVHPGYGFLSENEGFSRECGARGVAFVGPPPGAIADMGSKAAAKAIMTRAGVPVTPGYWQADDSLATLAREAHDNVGFPLMIKAVKGGGGKGMRIVRSAGELAAALEACQREARASFGSSAVLIERYIERPRHIEFQVFADAHGHAVHLWERDCSVQRRHQKVLEEAPAPFMPPAVRELMGGAAVRAALAVGYVGAGTVEFMLDTEHLDKRRRRGSARAASDDGGDHGFYFMEMNCRLQVEHPVTELITGLDLVEWQLRVASGQRLPLTSQAQVAALVRGHAVEARVYAENPSNGFLPATGLLRHLRAPQATTLQARADVPAAAVGAGAGAEADAAALASATPVTVRVDSAVRQGDAVSVFYDPMISKLVVHAGDRAAALRALHDALGRYQVAGLPNNLDFLQRVASHPRFVAGGVDTSFLGQHLDECLPAPRSVPPRAVALAALTHALRGRRAEAAAAARGIAPDPWAASDGARPGLPSEAGVAFEFEDVSASSASGSAATPGRSPREQTLAWVRPLGATSVGTASLRAERLAAFAITVGAGAERRRFVAAGRLVDVGATVAKESGGRSVTGTDAFRLTAHLVPLPSASLGSDELEDEAAGAAIAGAVSGSVPASASALVLHATVVILAARVNSAADGSGVVGGGVETHIWPEEGEASSGSVSAGALPRAAAVYRLLLQQRGFGSGRAAGGPSAVVTPMPGKVIKLLVEPHAVVEAAQPVLILESMKMETIVHAPRAGTVEGFGCKAGDFVADGKVLFTMTAAEALNAKT